MTTTPTGKIRVGIIGASANPFAWASTAHVPALRALPEFELVAVASRNQANAQAAAALHGIADAHGDYLEMVARPDLDLICVSTSSQHHHKLVMPVIEAGKNVFCEWPFGTSLEQAQEMRDAAKEKGVRTLVGLQTRYAPIVAYVRDLIAAGYIGTLWSVNFDRANDQTAQMQLTPEYLEFLDQANGGLRIMGGHALDTLAAYAGEFFDLQAYFEKQMGEVRLASGEIVPVGHKDHIFVQGRLTSGAIASVVMKQNSPTYRPFHLEISGSRGAIVISTGSDLDFSERHPGVPFEFTIKGTPALGRPFAPLTVPERYNLVPATPPPGQAVDVAHMYRHFADALARDVVCDTDFDHGVERHRLLETIVTAAAEGQRKSYTS